VRTAGPITLDVGNGYVVEAAWDTRYSVALDSDGDGVINAIDATPFSGAVVTSKAVVNIQGKPYLEISWEAAANTEYPILVTGARRRHRVDRLQPHGQHLGFTQGSEVLRSPRSAAPAPRLIGFSTSPELNQAYSTGSDPARIGSTKA
jgi:hypothetical protein